VSTLIQKIPESVRNWTGLVLAVYVLNFALTFHNVWPTLAITTYHEVSIEIVVLILSLALLSRHFRPITTRMMTVFAVLLTLMTLARYIEVTAPALFGRRVNLYWDAQYLPHVTAMMVEVAHPLQVIGITLASVLGLSGIFIALRRALVRITNGFKRPGEFRVMVSAMVILVIVFAEGYSGLPKQRVIMYSIPITKTYWQQAEFINSVLANEANNVLPDSDPLGYSELPRLGKSDLIVQFVESYGAAAYDTPGISSELAPYRNKLDQAVRDSKRRVVSAFIVPPTFGGNSWLSHSSFMTGLEINHLSTYELLVTQERRTLSDRLSGLGYRAVALMPGLRTEWPEGEFYGFEKIYGEREIDYRGPEFGWWRIPDQFSLARLAEQELAKPNRDPLFLLFTTISSHLPFRPIPPYQSDWPRLLSSDPYDKTALNLSLSQGPDWTNMQPAYAETLAYTYTYLGGFMKDHPDDDFVWVVIGDHQPPANVSGQGVRWDVPVHVISSDDEIIEALIKLGFQEGMTPAHDPVSTMHELPVKLLTVFAE
jgi:hypothetical protein